MSIIRGTRKAIESGSTVYGLVEANNGGFITVRLFGSGSRLTNLPYVGSRSPQKNDQVIVDYSTGNQPIVRLAEGQVYSGEAYMLESQRVLEMLPAETDPKDDGGAYFGGQDVGFGITTKVGGTLLSNEPHSPDTSWIQHWGRNKTNWQSAIYDSANWDNNPIGGKQYFTIEISGIYMLSFTSLMDIAGEEGANPLGTLQVRVMRSYGTASDVALMKGVSPSCAYNSFYNIDIDKVVYLPAGEVLSVEVVYTGDITEYAMRNSENPLKWLATQNEMIFKAQMIYQVDDIEEPEVPTVAPDGEMTPEYHALHKFCFGGGGVSIDMVGDLEWHVVIVNAPYWCWADINIKGIVNSGSHGVGAISPEIECYAGSEGTDELILLSGDPLEYGGYNPSLTDPGSTVTLDIGQTKWLTGSGNNDWQTGYFTIRVRQKPGSCNLYLRLKKLKWGSTIVWDRDINYY